ncbi:TPA: pyruvate ferredoxin oxidoreductase [Candidatus Falkowbacteria bacterium]|nr:pyruvate ferredoxin oxidoreductase [Candidatus Falkowbacteria bacterium]
MIVALTMAVNTLGDKTIVCGATGCSEVTTTKYPASVFRVPYIHSLFENPAPVATGVLAMLKRKKQDDVNVVVHGGDGFFFDIGLALNSGAWTRGDNILYICYDNEAYMNTGAQSSGSTPIGSYTMTTPATSFSTGNLLHKKDLPAIALAHGLPYVATATVGDLSDFREKVKKAAAIKGPRYIQVYSTCAPGWNVEACNAIKVAKLAQETGLYPVFEYVNGRLSSVMKVPNETPRVERFLELQGRFRHLGNNEEGKKIIKRMQKQADENIERFGLR